MTKKELWLRIKNYHFDHIVPPNMWEKIVETFGGTDASTKAFADKISRKHACSKRYALKAVNEYKKFIYLAVISDFHVTPSQAIDKVWHEHILFTQAYRTFCDEIIEYNLNHHPELLPLEEQTARYHAQYLDTLNLYVQEFGILPTDNVWDITKYDKEKVIENIAISREKKKNENLYYSSNSYSSDIPLYAAFDGSDMTNDSFPEFSGFDGGEGGGGGASGSWDSDGYGDDGGDSADGGDSGDGGGDGGCGGGCGGGD
jgi:hypothetical protein